MQGKINCKPKDEVDYCKIMIDHINEDLPNLTHEELGKVYKFVRKLIAEL
jgi:hypothetical protein